MKVIIEHEGMRAEVEDKEAVYIWDVRDLLRGALLAVTFQPESLNEIFKDDTR